MFTWICPQCGREVPPSYTDCPDCKERNAQAAAQQPPATAPAVPPMAPVEPPVPPRGDPQQPQYYQQPPQAPPPPQYQGPPQYQSPPQYQAPPQQPYYAPPAPPRRGGGIQLPVWLMTVLFAFAIGGVVLGIVWLMSSNKTSAGSGPSPAAVVESPAAKPGAKANPLQKHIEITGVRFIQDAKKKTLVKFVLVNHSEADISGLAGNVTIWGRTQKSEEDAQGSFSFNTNLAPFESKELTVPLNTKFKIYELPDWQNITTDVQITAPAA